MDKAIATHSVPQGVSCLSVCALFPSLADLNPQKESILEAGQGHLTQVTSGAWWVQSCPDVISVRPSRGFSCRNPQWGCSDENTSSFFFLSSLAFSGLKDNACSNSCVVYVFLLALLSYLNGNVKQSWRRLGSNEMTEWSLTTFIIWSRVKAPPEPLDFTTWIRFQVILKMHIMHAIDRHRSELHLSVLRYHTDRSICVKVTAHLNT